MTEKYKIPTKNYVNIRPNNYNVSPKSKNAKLEATYGRATSTKTKGEKKKQCIENYSLSNTKTTNKYGWKKSFKVLFY